MLGSKACSSTARLLLHLPVNVLPTPSRECVGYFLILRIFYTYLCMCVSVRVRVSLCVRVELRHGFGSCGQHKQVSSLLPCKSQGANLGHLTQQQALLSTEPSHWGLLPFLFNNRELQARSPFFPE